MVVGIARNNSSSGSYGYDVGVVKYTASGELDTGFSENGKVMTDINSSGQVYTDDRGAAVVAQPDGKIVVAGTTRQYTKSGSSSFEWYMWDLLLLRYLPNGDLDPDFADEGKFVLDLNGSGSTPEGFNDIGLQSDGKIIGVGYQYPDNNRFLIGRFNTDGTVDTSFGSAGDGFVIEHFPANTLEDAYDLVVLPDDSLIVIGRGVKPDGNSTVSILKLTPDGLPDATFASGGRFTTTISGTSEAYVGEVDSQGRIVVAGKVSAGVGGDESVLVLRLLENGTLDGSFGNNGVNILRVGEFKYQAFRGIVVHENGDITAVGSVRSPYNFLLARWNDVGVLDTTFGQDGIALFGFAQYPSVYAWNAILLPGDQILIGGDVQENVAGKYVDYFAALRVGTIQRWDDAFIAMDGGWNQLDWFGMYAPLETDWIYHESGKFINVLPGSSPADMQYYSPEEGWLWTSDQVFPWQYSYDAQDWLSP